MRNAKPKDREDNYRYTEPEMPSDYRNRSQPTRSARPPKQKRKWHWTDLALDPLVFLAGTIVHLITSTKLLRAFALACFMMSTEQIYMLSGGQTFLAAQECRQLIPKMGISDNSCPHLLIPPVDQYVGWGLNRLTQARTRGVINRTFTFRPNVYGELLFLLSLVLAAIFGTVERKLFQPSSETMAEKLAELDKLSRIQVPEVLPDSLAVAKLKRIEVQSYGMGKVSFNATLVIMFYAVELWAAWSALNSLNGSKFIKILYGLLGVFGFEVTIGLADRIDSDDDEN